LCRRFSDFSRSRLLPSAPRLSRFSSPATAARWVRFLVEARRRGSRVLLKSAALDRLSLRALGFRAATARLLISPGARVCFFRGSSRNRAAGFLFTCAVGQSRRRRVPFLRVILPSVCSSCVSIAWSPWLPSCASAPIRSSCQDLAEFLVLTAAARWAGTMRRLISL
jgi:hypothetical protein